ncbi:MAG: hypothetical protein FJ014_19725 [Chloroflexi bacterium]|nr:hypothetical protein [Chloroflexota bacterium]
MLRRRYLYLAGVGLLIFLGLTLWISIAGAQETKPGCRYFQQTGFQVCNEFLDFFEKRGGVDIFGYPICNEIIEGGLRVQYFQRARMERHPGNPGPYKVQLGLLGSLLYGPPAPPVPKDLIPSPSDPCARYFPETGQVVEGAIWEFYRTWGGLDIFGYPISPELMENGLLVQYFQRARLEWDPNTHDPCEVQLGPLGLEWQRRHPIVSPTPTLTPMPIPPPWWLRFPRFDVSLFIPIFLIFSIVAMLVGILFSKGEVIQDWWGTWQKRIKPAPSTNQEAPPSTVAPEEFSEEKTSGCAKDKGRAHVLVNILIGLVLAFLQGTLYLYALLIATAACLLYVFSPFIMHYLAYPTFLPTNIADISPRIDNTTVALLLIVVVLSLFSLISHVKIFDILEIRRDLTRFKEDVDEKFGHITDKINILTASVQNTLTAVQIRSTQASYINVFVGERLERIEEQLGKTKYRPTEDSVDRIRQRDLPEPKTPLEGVVSLFRLRFLIEEKLRNLAQARDIEVPVSYNLLELNRKLLGLRVLDEALSTSIKNILQITDEVVGGIPLAPEQVEAILSSGATILASLDKIRQGEGQGSERSL